MSLGDSLRARRLALGFSQTGLSAEMGGSISPTWISRYENDEGAPARHTAKRLAEALRVEEADMLNAFGFASHAQETAAQDRIARLVGVPDEPRIVEVVDTKGKPTGRTVKANIAPGDPVVAVELDESEPPWKGTVIVNRMRRERDGDPVVATVGDAFRAGRYRRVGYRRIWLERTDGDITDMTPFGVIVDRA